MPADFSRLQRCLAEMKEIYLADPKVSVRSQSFINVLHDFLVAELRRHGIDESIVEIVKEAEVYGSHKLKKVDIAVVHPVNGPQIMIGVRSQMSSVGKNLLTYYEEIIGDVISLHDRFPMAVVGYVYLLPTEAIIPGRKERVDLERAASLFEQITERPYHEGYKDKYEHFAFLPVDFTSDPPTLLEAPENLRIDNFIDKMLNTYRKRNIFLNITK